MEFIEASHQPWEAIIPFYRQGPNLNQVFFPLPHAEEATQHQNYAWRANQNVPHIPSGLAWRGRGQRKASLVPGWTKPALSEA